ncbi:hypothetical protein PoB_003475800 [Plakobranchus ocellatus]|uniref:Uncharacterized protein n=1 Tax=Plakobranchus ocellatus TaxID=259542 RepID=A0AAV4AN73_9GAST|nr:hypothetical protein PoB_003475800 [Plakobranchus ocellatus]
MAFQANQPSKRHRWRPPVAIETHVTTPQETQQQKTRDDSIVLEHVLGMTVYSNSALTCDPRSGLVAYPAGCVLVLLDSVKNKQLGTLHTPRKSITAVSFSSDGRYVLTGESGLQPAVRVWDVGTM